jgi:transmembrane sensor
MVKKKMMKTEIPYDKIARYLAGQANVTEREEIESWINSSAEAKKEFGLLQHLWYESNPKHYEINTEAALKNVSDKISSSKVKKLSFSKTWMQIAAAIIVLLGCFSIYQYAIKGGSGGIIVAANTTLSPITLKLSDGSVVILNKNSTFSYPKKFGKSLRKVTLNGEAYFEIAHDSDKPFIIESGAATTRVLGTKFNLKAYLSDTSVILSVTEGLVSFGLTNNSTRVKVGETGKINRVAGKVSKFVNTDPNFLSWKTGRFSFKNCLFKDAIKPLSEYYNTTILFDRQNLDTMLFNADFDSIPFNGVIENIELAMGVKIVQEKGVYYIR